MSSRLVAFLKACPAYLQVASVVVVSALLLALANCGSNSTFTSNPAMGSATVSISDPPSCRFPAGEFKSAFITIRSVQAHLSSTANPDSPGWQELAPQLVNQPVQVDLLALPTNGCLLAMLGSTKSLPVGDFQQIRLLLRSNDPASGEPKPLSNSCGSEGFNCVVFNDNSIHEILLSSEATTGLKIPPGRIVGGPIRVEAGKDVDINIDFNVCDSLLEQGNGEFRLRPALTAGQVQTNTTGISGTVVDSKTKGAIGGTVLVALEQPDGTGVDRVLMQTATDANGNFNFCPLVTGTYDVVAVAINGSGVAYNASVVLGVPSGTVVGQVLLVAETGSATGPGEIQGFATATTGTAPASIDVALSALQTISLGGGASRQITISLEGSSTPNIELTSNSTCPAGSPANTNCAQYTLFVPASNPSFGTFAAGGFTLSTPAAGDVLYSVEGDATKPSSGGTPICSPAVQTTDKDSANMPLKVTAGATTTAKRIDFSGCS